MQTFKRTIISLVSLSLLLVRTSAAEKTVTLGGSAGWTALSVAECIERGRGRLGYEALQLSSSRPVAERAMQNQNLGQRAELDLSFDESPFTDASGNYSIVSSAFLSAGSKKARRGTGAALCNTDGQGLTLRGGAGTIFATPGNPGSFSIEFWMYPAVTENGSVLFQWRSSRTDGASSRYQYIRASLFKNHLEWTFSNVWASVSGAPAEVVISGRKNLIPGQWSLHQLFWDSATGLLEYRLDGSTEDLRYLTSTGREKGEVYTALFGSAADIEIAPRFSGLVDDFRILRGPAGDQDLAGRHALLEKYPASGGRFVTMPIDAGRFNSSLLSVTAVESVPAGTDIRYFVRGGDNFYEWTDDFPVWVPVDSGELIPDITGRYFQVSAFLYPDGTGSRSPSVASLTVRYEEDSPPDPPVRVYATAGNGSVSLDWPASIDSDAAGYLVYYGEHSGEYLAPGSPLDAGNVRSCTISGLLNGKLYFFSVAAYDASGVRYPGELSAEVSARPKETRR